MAIQKITAAVLGNNAVTAASVAAGTLSAADIADNSITAAKLSTSTFAIDSLTVNTSDLVVDTANNRVGIGTNSPNAPLEIKASTTAIRLTDADNTSVYHEIVNDSNTGLSIKVDQGDANGSSYFRTLIDNYEYLKLDTTNLQLKTNIDFQKQDGMSISALESLVFKINSAGGQTGRVFQFNDNTSALMTLDQDGKLGIGMTPTHGLSVIGTGVASSINIGTVGASFPDTLGFFTSATAHTQTAYGDLNIKARTDYGGFYGIGFFTAASNSTPELRLKIDSSGNVGIGETSPVAKLHIQGTGTSGQVTSSFLLENASSGTAGMDITGAAGSSRLRLLYGGGPGTGTNNLTEALSVVLEGSGAGGIQIPTHSGYEIKFTGDSNGANIVAESEMYFLSDENNNSNAQSLMAFGGGGTNGLYSTSKIKTSTGTNGSATAYSATSFGNNMGSTTIGNYNGIEPMAPFHILKGGLTMNGFDTPGSVKYTHDSSDSGQWMHMNTMGRSGSGVGNFQLYIPTAQTSASWGSFGGDLFLSGYNGQHEYIIWRGYTNSGLAGASAVVVTGTGSPTITVGQNGAFGFYINVSNISMTHPIAMYRVCKGGNPGREWDLSEINGRWY